MWLLSADAGTLLSVVQFDAKKAPAMAKKHGALDGDFLLIRARVKNSLEYVADVLDALSLGEVEGYARPLIDEDKTADYHFRMIVTRDEWKKYVCYEVDGVNFSSHVKEETVARQPEPKIPNLYSALSATWSAWSKLQPNAPYSGLGGSYWSSRPDCKNCKHKEINHSIKGDSCTGGWNTQARKNNGCDCKKYEPKPVAAKALPAGKGAVGESTPDPEWHGTYTVTKPAVEAEGDALTDADGFHYEWCTFHDGDVCICSWQPGDVDVLSEYPSLVEELLAERDAIEDGDTSWLAAEEAERDGIPQEPPVPGETAREKKARNARNRRARRRATRDRRQQKQQDA